MVALLSDNRGRKWWRGLEVAVCEMREWGASESASLEKNIPQLSSRTQSAVRAFVRVLASCPPAHGYPLFMKNTSHGRTFCSFHIDLAGLSYRYALPALRHCLRPSHSPSLSLSPNDGFSSPTFLSRYLSYIPIVLNGWGWGLESMLKPIVVLLLWLNFRSLNPISIKLYNLWKFYYGWFKISQVLRWNV